MKPFTVFNYIWNLQWPCLQRQFNWKHVELTLNPRKVNTRGDTQTRPLDTPSRGGFPNFACTTHTHNCCQNYFSYFFFLLSSLIFCCFCCVFFGISFVDIWHKDYVILPSSYTWEGRDQPLLAGSVWDYTVMWALGFFLGQWKIAVLCQKRSMTNMCWKLFRKTQKSVHNILFTRAFVFAVSAEKCEQVSEKMEMTSRWYSVGDPIKCRTADWAQCSK